MTKKNNVSDPMLLILKEYQLMFWQGVASNLKNTIIMIKRHKNISLTALLAALEMDLKNAEKHIADLSTPICSNDNEERNTLCN